MLRKFLLCLVAILIALNASGCGPAVLTAKQQLEIINNVSREYDMTFELMGKFPEQPLNALLLFDGSGEKVQLTEYYGDFFFTGYQFPEYKYICQDKKTIMLYGEYFHYNYKDKSQVFIFNSKKHSILRKGDYHEITLPTINTVDRSVLSEQTWTIYLLQHKIIDTWKPILEIMLREELVFLLTNSNL